jgi:16S rRNA (guanine527-N7)-methyltransferase
MADIAQDMELLREGIARMGLSMDDSQDRQFSTYIDEIYLFNTVYRLVGTEGRDFVIKHLLDSLAPVPIIMDMLQGLGPEGRLCDVGSGAGLPGIPLAIMLADVPVSLVERMGRRSGFLRNVVSRCNLDHRVNVIQSDLSEVTDTFDVVTFRAFHPLEDIIRPVGNILSDRGFVCAYKGRIESIAPELAAVDALVARGKGGSVKGWARRIVPLSVPFLEAPRNLCILQKGETKKELNGYGN